jgi:hypothetical protein
MSIHIKDAMLCLDCDQVSPVATHCPVCASESVVELRTWLPPKDEVKDGDIVGKAENIKAAMEKLYHRMEAMMAETEAGGEEPLGVC